MNSFARTTLLSILISFSISAASAQEASFAVEKPLGEIKLATPFKLKMDASFMPGYDISVDTAQLKSPEFAVTAIEKSQPAQSGDKTSVSFTFTVLPFAIGVSTFPAMEWTLSAQGSTSSVKSPEVPLTITPLLNLSPETDIKDIRAPEAPFNFLLWALILAALAAAVYAYKHLRRNKNTAVASGGKPEEIRPPDVLAMDEIDRLLMSGLWEKHEHKQFYNALADILRNYISSIYSFDAMQHTSSELCRELNRTGEDKLLISFIRKFLQACDMVKFAKYLPDTSERDSDIKLLREIIKAKPQAAVTRPAPAPIPEVAVK